MSLILISGEGDRKVEKKKWKERGWREERGSGEGLKKRKGRGVGGSGGVQSTFCGQINFYTESYAELLIVICDGVHSYLLLFY